MNLEPDALPNREGSKDAPRQFLQGEWAQRGTPSKEAEPACTGPASRGATQHKMRREGLERSGVRLATPRASATRAPPAIDTTLPVPPQILSDEDCLRPVAAHAAYAALAVEPDCFVGAPFTDPVATARRRRELAEAALLRTQVAFAACWRQGRGWWSAHAEAQPAELPTELLAHVLHFAGAAGAAAATPVNQQWRDAAREAARAAEHSCLGLVGGRALSLAELPLPAWVSGAVPSFELACRVLAPPGAPPPLLLLGDYVGLVPVALRPREPPPSLQLLAAARTPGVARAPLSRPLRRRRRRRGRGGAVGRHLGALHCEHVGGRVAARRRARRARHPRAAARVRARRRGALVRARRQLARGGDARLLSRPALETTRARRPPRDGRREVAARRGRRRRPPRGER